MQIEPAKLGKVRAKFYKDEDGNRDLVEMEIVGDPNTFIRKVTAEDVERWPNEWAAYQRNEAEVKIEGTPLTDVPGIDRTAALSLKLRGVRTAEELAALDDAAATALGLGTRTFIKAAQNLVKLRELEKMQNVLAAASDDAPRRGPGRPPKVRAEDDAA